MNFRKLLVAGALSCSLALSSGLTVTNHAFAVQFSDTQGVETESSINKIVSLGVMRNPGAEFNPDVKLSRTEFAYIANQVVSLNAGKKLTFTDVSAKNTYYTNFLKMVNNGYLTTSKGSVNVNKGVTYSEFAKFLAQNLGLKSSWTNRPIDYLFYLVRKDVLDIDTDLDAIVTREEAAVALDKFITLKNTFQIKKGIVYSVSAKGFSLNDGTDTASFTNASNVSVFVGGQATEVEDIQVGMPATVYLNKKGQVAYYASEFLDSEEGALTLKPGQVEIGAGTTKLTKDLNIDSYVAPLPNRANDTFSIKEMDTYLKNGAEFAGQAIFINTDVVTALYPYISKITNKSIKVSGNTVTLTLTSDVEESFKVSAEAKVTLDGKEATLDKLTGNITATVEADKFGNITFIAATTTPAK